MTPVRPGAGPGGRAVPVLVGPLRRFAVVSALITALDVGLLVGAVRVVGLAVPVADALAVTVASSASWLLHRAVAGAGDPFVRWVDRPVSFVAGAVATGGLDVVVVTLVTATGQGSGDGQGSGNRRRRGAGPGAGRTGTGGLLGTKALALVLAGGLRVLFYRVALVAPTRRGLARRPGRDDPPGEVRFSVVVPAYREQERIGATVRALTRALAEVDAACGVEIVVVDDGSGDATAAEAAAAGARVVTLATNQGKGAAVRAGMLSARGRSVAFVDADLAYPPEQLLSLLAEVEAGWDVVVGSRRHDRSIDVAPARRVRALSGRLFNLLTAVVLLGHYRDTQCGCKAFRSDVARLVFSRTRVDGFAFDVEVFHLVERYRLSLTEVPVTLVWSEGSSVRVGVDALAMVRDLFRVRRWSGRGMYDPVAARADERGLPAASRRAGARP